MSARGGHWGRIARVNLTQGTVAYDEHDDTWYRRYGGGGAIGAYYMLREIPAGTDALDAGNVLVMASSIIAGMDAPGLSKHTVLAKSPLTGAVGESQSVSPYGVALAATGLDAIVVTGRAATPCILVAEAGEVRIVEMPGLWGLEVADAHDRIVSELGEQAHTALIGPSGEKLVRYASIVNDVRFMNCRTGLGAVMGSKQLKGIVSMRGALPPVLNQALANVAIDDYWLHRLECTVNKAQEEAGIASWIADTPGGEAWPLCSRNFNRVIFPGVAGISGSRLESDYKVASAPTPPNIEYARQYVVPSGRFAVDPRYGGLEGNSIAALGPMTWCDDLEAVLKMVEITYRYGLDPESLGGTLAWAMEASERGMLDLDVQFGDADKLVALAEATARREGIGDLLAEGSARAGSSLGDEARKISMTCKGKEIPPHEPRNKPGLALAYGVGPIGPDYCVIEHDWDYSPIGFSYILDKSRAYGMLERNEELSLAPRKVRQVVMLHRWWSGALESLLFDLFAVAPARYMPPTMMEALMRGITGWDLTIHEVMSIGERRIVMMQEFNRREGLTRDDDMLADRFYDDPIPEGKYQGAVLDRQVFGDAVDLYYQMSGFDPAGRPTAAKLYELELDWILELRG